VTKKNIFPVVATIAVVGVVLGVFSMTVMRDSNVSISTMTSEQAYANLSSKIKRIGVQEVKVNPQQLDVSEFLDAKDELPDIESSYPFVVVGNGDVNIEIFSSGEKAAESGSDSFLTEMAKKFNAQHNKTSGDKTMSVSLRSIPSGTAAEYISTGKYQPECYTPSNTLFGELVKNEGVELTVEADRLVGNVAGILVSKKTGDMLRSEYGEASVSSVLNATIDGKLMMGYSNPYTSATGLNFLLAALASSGSDTIVDTAAVENFQKFQANVPLVSFTTQQMVQSADKGIVDGVVMEYQSYQNDPTLQRNYEFIPFGVRHDNPLYSIGSISAEKKEVIAAFVSLCAQNQAEATKDGSLQLYVSRDTKSHEKIFILESADHKRVRVITGSANMSASAFCGIQRENIVCFDDEAAFSHYKVLFETFKETCSDNVSYKAVVNTMNQEDYLKENIKEVPVFQSIEKQKLVFLEQAQPEDEVEYEIVADVKKMQELVKPIMPKMPVQANRIVVAAEPMRVFGKRYTEVRRVAAEAVKQLPKLHIDYDAGTMTFNDENIDLNPNLSEVAKNIKSIQKFFSGMDYFYGDVEQAKKDYFKYMTWYLATPFMAYLRYFASRNNYDTKLFPMYGVIYGDSNGGKTTFIKFLVKLMCGETVKMNTTEDFTATRIDGLKRVCEGLPLNIDDLAKTQFQNHSERVIKNDEWGISDRLVNYPAVSITSNKITSLTKDLSKRAIICRIGAKIDNERGAKNSKRVNESMSELTTAFYGEYVRRMLVCIDEMTTEMRENANGKEYFPDIFHASSSVIADIFEACGIDLPDYVRILYYNDYMGDESIGRAAIEKIELAWQADPSKFRVDKKQNRLIYSYPPDGPWYELKYIADELPNSLEAEISGGNQLIMNYEQAQELFGIKFRRWLGIFNL
jgi:ngoFVII restriction endonuclease